MSASPEQKEHAVERAARVFKVVKASADADLPCPTNDALADRMGCGTTAICKALHFLECNGMIRVERGNDHRVVTIVASGRKTAGTVKNKHWSEAA